MVRYELVCFKGGDVTGGTKLKLLFSGRHNLLKGIPLFVEHHLGHILETQYAEAITVVYWRIIDLIPSCFVIQQTVVEGIDNEW